MGQACALLDADVFAHAAASLKDLRLYSGRTELPYAITLSEPLQQESDDARVLNLRAQSGHISFDLEMPHRPYTGLVLDLAATDFVATVNVAGETIPDGKHPTPMGSFTLFDLSSQRLSHSTSIPLSESVFPYLHLELSLTSTTGRGGIAFPPAPSSIVKSAIVPPAREAQSLYTPVGHTSAVQVGHVSVATFKVQSRVPIERVAFQLPPGYKGNFSREVKITARGVAAARDELAASTPAASFETESAAGTILRVHKLESGRELSADSLTVPVSVGSNMQQPAVVEVRIENSSDAPLPVAVELQMRQRRICFDMRDATGPLMLYYGDTSLDAPIYSDATLFHAAATPRVAQLGPEIENAHLSAAPPARKLTRPRPILRWVALLGCVCIFALLVFRRSARHGSR